MNAQHRCKKMSTLMYVDSENDGLEHSCHNFKHSVNAVTSHQHNNQAASELKNERLKSLKITFFNLAAAQETEKTLKAAMAFIEIAEARVIALK